MNGYHSRWIEPLLRKAMDVMPVVVVTGARQTGKTTLVRTPAGMRNRRYHTLDDIEVLEQAQRDPDALLRELPVTIDEVQRAPGLFLAVKRRVDTHRVPGSVLLTGSANLALMKSVAESLAGRAYYLELPPFCSSEWHEREAAGRMDLLFAPTFRSGDWPSGQRDWRESLLGGGYPPAIPIKNLEARNLWYAGYTQTYLERDLRNLSEVASLVDFQRLMSMAALRVARLLNQTDLSRDAGLPQPTCHRYLNLLETGYQIARLTNYTRNPATGLVKSRKLMWTDGGLAAWLAGIRSREILDSRPDTGFWLEQTIYQALQSWRSLAPDRRICFWRSRTQVEVDFVLEQDGNLVACEIKSSGAASHSDAQGLEAFCREFGRKNRLVRGVLLHGGKDARALARDLWALPYGALL